ncbi:ribosome maturation factor RimM [Clostridia bacterium]|nr:ribosome maturation factor RimM [Clostridia bacterium]
MVKWLRVGVITSPHGLQGEVKVFPTTDELDRFSALHEVYLDIDQEKKKLQIEKVRYMNQMVILKVQGWDKREDVERYRKQDLWIERSQALPLAENEVYIADILGFRIKSDIGEDLGYLKDVLKTGANDVYVVDTGDKELLLPSIPECILDILWDEECILVHILEGLGE